MSPQCQNLELIKSYMFENIICMHCYTTETTELSQSHHVCKKHRETLHIGSSRLFFEFRTDKAIALVCIRYLRALSRSLSGGKSEVVQVSAVWQSRPIFRWETQLMISERAYFAHSSRTAWNIALDVDGQGIVPRLAKRRIGSHTEWFVALIIVCLQGHKELHWRCLGVLTGTKTSVALAQRILLLHVTWNTKS